MQLFLSFFLMGNHRHDRKNLYPKIADLAQSCRRLNHTPPGRGCAGAALPFFKFFSEFFFFIFIFFWVTFYSSQ